MENTNSYSTSPAASPFPSTVTDTRTTPPGWAGLVQVIDVEVADVMLHSASPSCETETRKIAEKA